MNKKYKWGAVVLAGGEVGPKLSGLMGVSQKALANVNGEVSLRRVLNAVRSAGIEHCVTVGAENLRQYVLHGGWVQEGKGQIENAHFGMEALAQQEFLLFLPADSPFIVDDHIIHFLAQVEARLAQAGAEQDWFAAGLCPSADFAETYPEAPFRSLRLLEGRFLSGALYATTPSGFGKARGIVEKASRSRKSRAALLLQVGLRMAPLYALGRLSLPHAEKELGRVLGGMAIIVPDCHPATALDFDNEQDFLAIQKIAERIGFLYPS